MGARATFARGSVQVAGGIEDHGYGRETSVAGRTHEAVKYAKGPLSICLSRELKNFAPRK